MAALSEYAIAEVGLAGALYVAPPVVRLSATYKAFETGQESTTPQAPSTFKAMGREVWP